MVFAHFAPDWFYGIGMILEIIFFFVTLVVSLFAFNLYKKTWQKNLRLFGISFILISSSYFIQSILSFMIIIKLNESVSTSAFFQWFSLIQSINAFNNLGMFVHILLMMSGLAFLTYITFKHEDRRLLLLLILMPLIAIFFSQSPLYLFYLFSTIYLVLIEWHFIKNYLASRKINTMLIAFAFAFIFFGNFHFLISVNHQVFYPIGHMLEFVAYILILINFYMVKNEAKKRKS